MTESRQTEEPAADKLSYINFVPPDPDASDFWTASAVRGGSVGKRTLKTAVLMLLIGIVFLFMASLRQGNGWFKNLFTGSQNIEFTLPIADTPSLDSKYMNEDGTYTAAGVAKSALPSVVQIKVYSSSPIIPTSQGSGIIISSDGYIVTNAHVVSGADFGISVQLYDKTEYSAKLVGKDDPSDIAVIKIGAKDLSPAQFADSDLCELGDEVVTIGSPAGYENSVTKGIISGLDRRIKAENSASPMQCIQIDAAINPGNSGGPLFNMFGQVIGITSSKLVASDYDNIGFAITVNAAKPIIETLMADGYTPDKPRVGITYYVIDKLTAETNGIPAGIYVVEIDPECNVSKTKLRAGDIITEMNGQSVSEKDSVNDILDEFKAGDKITCRVFRPKSEEDLTEENGSYFDIKFKLNSDKSAMIRADEDK